MLRTASVFCVFLALVGLAQPQEVRDFSGVYTLKRFTHSDSNHPRDTTNVPAGQTTLKIAQSAISMELSYTLGSGKTVVRRYTLDGRDSANMEFDGTPTTDQASVKGRTLTIHSTIEVTAGLLKGIPVHRTSRWELSRDLKTLIAHDQIEIQGKHVIGDTLTAVYVRQ